MTLTVPVLVLVVSAVVAGIYAYRYGLFSPSPIEPAVGRPDHWPPAPRDSALPLLMGAFGVYLSWMILGTVISMASGLAAATSPIDASTPAPPPPLELVARTHLLVGVAIVPVALGMGWWARRASGRPVGFAPAEAVRDAIRALGWCCLVLPMVFTVGIGVTGISRALGQPVDRTAHSMLKLITDSTGDLLSRWMLVAVAVVVAPVLEEVIYRGLLQRALTSLTRSVWPAVLMTSALFTAMHAGVIPSGSFWPAASLIFTLSVFLGLLVAKTGTVVTSMVAHAAFNAVSIVVAVWWSGGEQMPG